MFRNPVSTLLQIVHKPEKWQWRHSLLKCIYIVKFFWRGFVSLVMVSYWPKFHFNIITVPELWQFTFIRDWPEIRKLEIPPFEFCPLSGDYGKLEILNLVQTPLIKSHWMLQNARVTAFIVSEVFWNNHQRGKINLFVLKSTTIPLWWKSEIHLLQLIITHRQQWQHVINNHKTKFLKPR